MVILRIEAENKYEKFLLQNWIKLGAGLFLVTVIGANLGYIADQSPTYQTNWTCEYNGSELKATGEANLFHKLTGQQWLKGPIQFQYENYTEEWNVASWKPYKEDCKSLVENHLVDVREKSDE